MVPNLLHIVVDTMNDYPRAWSKCHVQGDPEAHDFIILAARRMYDIDRRFGLNGKRGGNDLSWDAVNFNDSQYPNVVDVVIAAGSPSASPGWLVTNTTGKFFNPYEFKTHYNYNTPVPVPPPTPTPTPPPTECNCKQELETIKQMLIGMIHTQTHMDDKLSNVESIVSDNSAKITDLRAHLDNRLDIVRAHQNVGTHKARLW